MQCTVWKVLVAMTISFDCLLTPSMALTEAEIQQAIAKGQAAAGVKEAPPYIKVGTKSPKGSFARTVMLGTSEAPYWFFVRGCKQWVASMAFRASMDNTELDVESIRNECLGEREEITVFVAANTTANEALAPQFGYAPIASKPVTAIILEFGDKMLKPLSLTRSGEVGDGNASAVFDGKWFKSAKSVSIVATINSEYQLELKIPQKVLNELF